MKYTYIDLIITSFMGAFVYTVIQMATISVLSIKPKSESYIQCVEIEQDKILKCKEIEK